ncbi:unnamed protein product [Rhizoctonia solani]|uniref:Uncharacterized protein n=1 Tax=Rhizoctonia solani TaxID=456999 RepID=A0A8H2XRI6_9AGAM|nr:unnamed protein product [Rhizoctonia solani]
MPPAFNLYNCDGRTHQRQQSQGGRVDQATIQPDHRPYAPLTPTGPVRTGSTESTGATGRQSYMNRAGSQGSR